jgi:hypothetical protein
VLVSLVLLLAVVVETEVVDNGVNGITSSPNEEVDD